MLYLRATVGEATDHPYIPSNISDAVDGYGDSPLQIPELSTTSPMLDGDAKPIQVVYPGPPKWAEVATGNLSPKNEVQSWWKCCICNSRYVEEHIDGAVVFDVDTLQEQSVTVATCHKCRYSLDANSQFIGYSKSFVTTNTMADFLSSMLSCATSFTAYCDILERRYKQRGTTHTGPKRRLLIHIFTVWSQ